LQCVTIKTTTTTLKDLKMKTFTTTTAPTSKNTFTMKKIFTAMVLLLSLYGSAQTTTTVTYPATSAIFANPDRGLYKFTAASSGSYQLLNQSTVTNYRLNDKITLLYREFRLEDFKNGPISASFLANMQSDFNIIRNAGMKCIIRFTYSNNESVAQRDATKATILSHIQQLKPMLQSNVDIISMMQAGFIGTWGEWYYTSQAEFGGGGYNNSSMTAANISNRREVLEAMLSALPSSRMIQVRTPAFKRDLYTTTALSDSQGYNGTSAARIGHFNDCFLASSDDYGTYVNTTTEYPYLAQDTKFTPMGGETCAVNSPRSDCSSAITEMAKFHWSFLNVDYHTGVIGGFQSNNCFTEIQNRLGYRFELVNGVFPQSASIGNAMAITLKIKNNGFSTPFNERKVYLVLRNASTNQEYTVALNTNPRLWASGVQQTITENVTLPTNMVAGSYKLYLKLPDTDQALSTRPEYSVRMANESTWESNTGYNNLMHTVSVGSSLGVDDNTALQMNIYPVPADNELIIEFAAINDYKVSVYNALGQKVDLNSTMTTNKMTLNTQGLSNGVYFVQFQSNERKDTKRIIVNH
jgi:hypothetical protein